MKFLPGPRAGRALHPDRSALPRLEDARAQLQDPVHRPRGRAQHRDAALLGPQGRARRSTTRARRCGAPRCWCSAWPTSGTSTTSARARRSTSSGCWKGRGRGSATPIPTCPASREDGHEYRSVPLEPRDRGRGRLRDGRDRPHRRGLSDDRAATPGWWSTLETQCRKRRDMHVAVIGSGYVGLVAGACLAETGNDVVCVDKDADKIARLQRNEIPIYEPGLEPMVQRNQAEGRLTFTTDIGAAIRGAKVIFIAVGHPAGRGRLGRPPARAGGGARDRPAHERAQGRRHQVHRAGRHRGKGARGGQVPDRGPVRGLLQSRVPEGRRRDRGLHEARPRGHRGGRRRGARRDGRALRAVHPAGRQPDPLHGHRLGRGDQVRGQRDARHPHLVHEPDGAASASWSAPT